MAPLNIKFTSNGTLGYVTFHGSWNRDKPAGYKLSVVSFADGKTAAVDVLSNADLSACPWPASGPRVWPLTARAASS